MAHEHTGMGDANETLNTSNYEIETSSAIEWAFVATPDKPPEGGWPIEKKLERAQKPVAAKLERSRSLTELVASGAQMRQPMPLDVLNSLMAEKNLKLEELGEPALMLAEMFASRLYTGPLFVKYNGVLRGLDSPVPFLKHSMIELCCPKAVYEQYMGGAEKWEQPKGTLSYEEVKKELNTYTTTLHAINSSIVKLGKLTVATKVFRGISGRVLPKEFWEANEFGVKGGIESAFMSTTLNEKVAISYASSGDGTGFVFEIQQGMVDRGADIGFISQYPHEKEILFAPLTGLEVRSTRVKGSALVVEVALSVNLASLTIEQVIGKRRALIDQMAEQQVEPVKLRLKEYGKVEEGLARFRKEVAAARKDDPEWYNDDGNFLVGVKGVQRATRLALGVVKEIRLELVKELREQGATHAEVLLEGEGAWIVEDKEWAAAVGSKEALLKGLEADEEGRLAKVNLHGLHKMTSLPESVGECTALQTLSLYNCKALTSLPERMGECKPLQTLILDGSKALTSLP
jgi:hypothetical protein